MKKIKHLGALLSFLLLSQFIFAQAGSTFTNPMNVGSLPFIVTGDSTCGYGDNYTTTDIACTGSYMSGDEKIYSFTPTSNITSFNVEMTNISDTWSGIFVTDDSTSSGNCLGNVGSSGTATRGVYGVSLVSGTTYYIIVSTYATPQCISSFDINMYIITCPAPSSLTATDITYDSVSIDWTENGTGTSWIIEWDTNGFTQGTGNTFTTTINPDTLTGLNPSTDYSYYVRTFCGAGDSSTWVGPLNFTTLPTCPAPSALGVSNLTSTSVDLDWTESGSATLWEYDYDTAGFAQGAGTMDTTSSNPFSVSGLIVNTSYEFYVRAICGAGDSSTWVGPFSFVTLPSVHTLPLPEDFESGFTNFANDIGNDVDWVLNTSYYHGGVQSIHNAYSSSDVNIVHESGILDLSTTTNPVLEFWHIAKTEGGYDKCYIEISTDNGATYTSLPSSAYLGVAGDYGTKGYFHEDSYSAWGTGTQTPDNTTWWKKETFTLSAYLVANVRVRFRLTSDGSGQRNGWYLDDILISEPTCPDPSALMASIITTSSADLGWTENGTATTWDLEWDTTGFTQGTGTMVSTTANPYSITGLTSNTTYQFYVKADCGSSSSTWVGPFAFTTPCAVVVPQFFEPFDSFLPSACWEQAGSGTPANGPSGIGSSSWGQSGFPGSGTGGTRINLYTTGKEEWILTPIFDLSTGGPYEIKIDAIVAAYSGGGQIAMGSDDTVQVLISNDGGTTWAAIYTWDSLNAPGNTAAFTNIDLTAYSSATTQFAIWATEGTVDDAEDYWFYIGSFEVRDIPTCPEPITFVSNNVTYFSVDLSWVEQGSATLWEYQYDTSGFALGTGIMDTTSSNPYTLLGLTQLTNYDVYVRAVCGAGDSSTWVGPLSFSTPPSCPQPDTLMASNFSPSSADLGWVEMGVATAWQVEYDTAGYTQGTGTLISTSTNPVSLIALNANQGYEYYVRSVCGAGDSSIWVGPYYFSTTPDTIMTFPYTNDLESGLGIYLGVRDSVNSAASVDTIANNASTYGVLLTGKSSTGWTGGSTNTTETQAFGNNSSHISAIDMVVDASSLTSLSLNFDLKQTYTYGAKYSWARVTVNGVQIGLSLNPTTANTDPFTTVNVDLSAYAGTSFVLSIEHSGKYSEANYSGSNGDDAYIDNIKLYVPVMATAVVDSNVTCFGLSNGGATVTATEGSAPYNFMWSNAATTASISGVVAGVYDVTVYDSDGDSVITSVTITEPAMLVSTVAVDSNVSCFGMMDGGSTVSVTGGTTPYAYSWSTTDTTASITGLAAGTYYVTVADSNSCSITDSVVITEPVQLAVDLGNDTSVCNGAVLTLDAGMGYASYLWSDNTTAQTLVVPTTTAGTVDYSIEVEDANGCSANDTVSVTTFATVNVAITGSADLCAKEVATLDAGSGFVTYTWNTTETTQTVLADAAVLGTGTHTFIVTVTDANGCAGDATTSFDVFAPVVVDLGEDTAIIWYGSDTIYILDAGAGFAGYLWSDGTTNQTNDITLANSGYVIVVVTDGNGCTGSDTVLVDFILSVPTFEVASLKMYPNPADNQVNIELNNFKNIKNVNVTFLSITGIVVLTERIQVSGNSYSGTFDVSHLATGTYFVQFEANGEVITRQFVIK